MEDRIRDLERRVEALERDVWGNKRLGPDPSHEAQINKRTEDTLRMIHDIIDRNKTQPK